MTVPTSDAQKKAAIEAHSLQASEFADAYRAAAGSPYDTCFAYSRHRLAGWLDRCLPARGDGQRLLDVGCGTGHHLAALHQRGFAVAGVDGSDEMLRHARAANPSVDLRQADVDALPFQQAEFDIVICIEVLRYLPDARCCVGEMARVLRPGGLALATATPLLNLNAYWLVNRLAAALPVRNFVRLKQYFTTTAAMRRVFAQSGFTAVEVHGVYLGPVNWVERLAPRLLPRLLRASERLDSALADLPYVRELANMFLVRAVRG